MEALLYAAAVVILYVGGGATLGVAICRTQLSRQELENAPGIMWVATTLWPFIFLFALLDLGRAAWRRRSS